MTEPESPDYVHDPALIEKVDRLSDEVRGLARALDIANELVELRNQLADQALKAVTAATEARVAAASVKRRSRRIAFLVVALAVVIGSFEAQTIHAQHTATSNARDLLNDELNRAVANYAGCLTRNRDTANLDRQAGLPVPSDDPDCSMYPKLIMSLMGRGAHLASTEK